MFGIDTHTPHKTNTLFKPRLLRTTSIPQIDFPTFIRELKTQEPYYETYAFWKNPESILTTKDLEALYQQWEGEGFHYYQPEEEIGLVWYV